MCAPPSRCLDMSSRQLVLAINATNAIAIITSDSGSLPKYKASHHLYEYAHSQDQLQYTSKMRGTYLHFHAMSNRIKGKPVHRRIGKIVQGSPIRPVDRAIRPAVISTTNRSALMPSNQRRVPDSCLAEAAENFGGLDGLRICSDGFLKRGA